MQCISLVSVKFAMKGLAASEYHYMSAMIDNTLTVDSPTTYFCHGS